MSFNKIVKRIFFGKSPRRTFIRAFILAGVALVTFKFILIPARLEGKSMEPTYRDGSFNFVNTLAHRFREPRRGEVIAIRMAGEEIMLLKRIIGLPGERIAFREGVLLVDEKPVPEPYLKIPCAWSLPEVKAGEDEFFVIGDNRQVPLKNHLYGRVKRDRIVGKVLF